MKVLMTADAVGGVWTYATDLATGLAARGVEVVLAVLGPPPTVDSRDRYSGDTRLLSAPLDWTAETPEALLAAGSEVAALAQAERVDIVHLNSPALAAGGAFRTPVLGVCHSDVATWWAAVRGSPLPPDLAWRADLTGRGYAACHALIAPSQSFADATAAAFALPRVPEVVHNGSFPLDGGRWPRGAGSDGGDLSTCALASASAAHDRSKGQSGGEITPIRPGSARPPSPIQGEGVFTCGRLWDEGKGMATLDAAAAMIEVRVHAAGSLSGPNQTDVTFDHLNALGALPATEIAARMADCAVFVSPSLYEPFGLAVLEAAQSARPLVLSDIPTFRELWDDAAIFVPPRDAPALAAALNRLLTDPAERARLGEAARQQADRYTLDATFEGTLAAYRALTPRRIAA